MSQNGKPNQNAHTAEVRGDPDAIIRASAFCGNFMPHFYIILTLWMVQKAPPRTALYRTASTAVEAVRAIYRLLLG
jgi:hypothetical protein